MAVTKVVSIEVTDSSTRVIEMGFGRKDQNIYKAVIFDTPAHTVADGVIENPDVFAQELTNQLKTAGIHSKDCIFALNTSKVISREVTTAELKDEQIADFIESQKGEYFPMDTTGYIMVYRIVERNKDAKTMRMNVFGVPGRIIQTYQEVAAAAGLKVLSMDYSGNAMYQWLQNDNHKEMDIYLGIGEQSTVITILENKVLALQRNLNFGVNLLADRVIGSGYYQEDLNRKTAIAKLSQEELVFSSINTNPSLLRGESEAAEALNNLKSALTEGMKQFINNVSRVLEYYHTKSKDSEISKIYIGGTGARVKGLKALLENEFIGVEIIVLDQLPDLKLSHAVVKSGINTTELISCIGAVDCSLTFALPSEKEKMQKTLILCIVAFVLVLAAAAVVVFLGKKKYDAKQKELDIINAKVAQLEAGGIEELEVQYNSSFELVSGVEDFDDGTYRYSEEWNNICQLIEERAAQSVVLEGITSSQGGLVLSINVANKTDAAKTIMELRTIPYFSNVSVTSLEERIDDQTLQHVVKYTASCTYQYYFDEDINGDGVVNEKDDITGDGVIDKLDLYGDYNFDDKIDRRDIEKKERDLREERFQLIANDINNDGVFDENDDINMDTFYDATDRKLFSVLESGVGVDVLIPEDYGMTPEIWETVKEKYGYNQTTEQEVVK